MENGYIGAYDMPIAGLLLGVLALCIVGGAVAFGRRTPDNKKDHGPWWF
jgi:hypothetical protein